MFRKKTARTRAFGKSYDEAMQDAVKIGIAETAARAAVTATVTFAVGWLLKRTFEKTVAQNAQSACKTKPSMATNSPAVSYKQTRKRPDADNSNAP